jgi:pyruvate/2-oxoglutarate dehydrogenase complex dihydrolipoamide dehydrogenase (E3) component
LLPREEPETSRLIEEVFVREGITVDTGERVSRVSPMPVDGVKLTLTSGKSVQAQRLLVAVGRRADTENLNLDAAGIEIDERGTVVTTSTLATTAKGVWAAGDVTGRLPFTHAAFAMGRLAASNALGHRLLQRNYHPEATPWVTFTDPEVARVGLTEAAVAAKGGGRVAYLPMAELDRAITADATDGFIKLLAGPRQFLRNVGGGKVLGATIVAERAGELIGEPALAMATGMFTGRLAQAIHAYPTWSSGLQLAAAQFFFPVGGRAAKPARQA